MRVPVVGLEEDDAANLEEIKVVEVLVDLAAVLAGPPDTELVKANQGQVR